jgi:hypothetical protein
MLCLTAKTAKMLLDIITLLGAVEAVEAVAYEVAKVGLGRLAPMVSKQEMEFLAADLVMTDFV